MATSIPTPATTSDYPPSSPAGGTEGGGSSGGDGGGDANWSGQVNLICVEGSKKIDALCPASKADPDARSKLDAQIYAEAAGSISRVPRAGDGNMAGFVDQMTQLSSAWGRFADAVNNGTVDQMTAANDALETAKTAAGSGARTLGLGSCAEFA